MIYLDNIIFNLQQRGGISKYWYNINKYLISHNVEFSNVIYSNAKNFLNIHSNKTIKKKINFIDRYLPCRIDSNEKFIFHSSYYRYCNNIKSINVVTVYDFIYEKFKSGLPKLVHSLQKKNTIKKAKKIICISENTKRDLLEFYKDVNEEKIAVIGLGADEEVFQIKENKNLSNKFSSLNNQKYILFLANPNHEYKNFKLVDAVISHFDDIKIVIINNSKFDDFKNLVNNKNFNKIYVFNSVSDEELNNLYNSAMCLFYPSLYEGFGIPVIESMMAGCPVITFSNSSMRELVKDYYLNISYNKDSISQIIDIVRKLSEVDYKKKIEQSGIKISKNYSWNKCGQKTLNIYNDLLK
jgi:mannosyltransferase